MDKPLQSFGRRKGRKMRASIEDLYEELMPQFGLDTTQKIENLTDLFQADVSEVWLEIGFGGGEHLRTQIEQNPKVGIIGCEPFINGVASLIKQLNEADYGRVRIHNDDVRQLFDILPQGQLSRVYILFPDPWPKKRHFKRRLVQPELLDVLHTLLKKGGEVRLASDIHTYVNHMQETFWAHKGFKQVSGPTELDPDAWPERPTDWPKTRYEQKATTKCAYLVFKKT